MARLPWTLLARRRENVRQEQERQYLLQLGRDAGFDRATLMERLPEPIRIQLAACSTTSRDLFFRTLQMTAEREDQFSAVAKLRRDAAQAKRERKAARRAREANGA